MSPEKLAHMANQIAGFFATQPGDDQAARVAQHLRDFWEPRMRSELKDLVRQNRVTVHPLVGHALETLG